MIADELHLQRFASSPEGGASEAVLVENSALLHTTQLFPVKSAGDTLGRTTKAQFEAIFDSLQTILASQRAERTQIVKLNVYLRDEADHKLVSQMIRQLFEASKLPAVSYVQTKLIRDDVKIALDAVVALNGEMGSDLAQHHHLAKLGGNPKQSHVSLLPRGDVVYVSGQAEAGELNAATLATLESLLKTLSHLQLDRRHVVGLKCFLTPTERVGEVEQVIADYFKEGQIPVVSYVEWIAGETRPIEIELIAAAPHTISNESVTYFTPPELKASPVFSRTARIHGDRRIYISGLYSAEPGDGAQQTRMIFDQLEQGLSASGSDMQHLAKATYYVSSSDASDQLNQIRPSLYDPARPPAASKAVVSGVGMNGRQLSIDMIAAPAIHEEE
ncbi:MAG TPA: RidA family protein, partial [Planctomycetaceae bacterium]|nr:RidA family protein [Planctomycetaceae bacterium]